MTLTHGDVIYTLLRLVFPDLSTELHNIYDSWRRDIHVSVIDFFYISTEFYKIYPISNILRHVPSVHVTITCTYVLFV